MSNPCIGPNGVRYLFVVRKSNEMWISRRFFILSKIDDYDLMGQYLRDMWYMETLSPDDIREFMIIPIRKGLVVREFVKTLRACSNQTSCADIRDIVRNKYGVDWIYSFELSKHAIQKYITDDKDKDLKSFELHHIGSRYGNGQGPYMKLTFQARQLKTDDEGICLHISNPEFQTYR